MATASPSGFDVLGQCVGGMELEKRLHKMLESDRVNGEWFKPTTDVLAVIDRAIAGEFSGVEQSNGLPITIKPEDEFSDNIVVEARFYLNELMKREWRGIGDTDEGVRNRVADACGISHSYAFRISFKHQEINDISGSVYRSLRINYAEALEAEGRLNDGQRRFLNLVRRNVPTSSRADRVCPELADYPTLEEEFNIPAPGEVK